METKQEEKTMDFKLLMDTLKSIQQKMATKEDIDTIRNGNEKLQKDVEEIKLSFNRRIMNLEDSRDTLMQKMNANLKSNRAKNILIFKVEEKGDKEENIYKEINDIFKKVGVEMNDFCIEAAFRIGKPGRNRPILIRFIAPRWKSLVFEKVKEFGALGLAISNDLSQEERLIRKELVLFKNKFMKEGEQNIKIKENYLIIDGKNYSLNDLRLMDKGNAEGAIVHGPFQQLETNSILTPDKKKRLGRPPGSKRQLSTERRSHMLDKFISSPSTSKKAKQEN